MDYKSNESLVGIKNLLMTDPIFEGHFPGKPIYPGVLLIECLAQCCAAMLALDTQNWIIGSPIQQEVSSKIGILGSVKMDLLQPVFPESVLTLSVQKIRQANASVFFETSAFCKDQKIAKGSLIVGLADSHYFKEVQS